MSTKHTHQQWQSTGVEISTCPQKNYEYWTDMARFHLALYREHRHTNAREAAWMRQIFRKDIRRRREQEFLETANAASAIGEN